MNKNEVKNKDEKDRSIEYCIAFFLLEIRYFETDSDMVQ